MVTETYPPEHGGAPLVIERFVSLLRERGRAVSVVRPRQRHESDRLDDGGLMLLPSLTFPLDRSLRVGLPALRALDARWRADRPDVVHIATQGPLGLGAMASARRLRIPVSTSFHTNFHRFAPHYGLGFARRPVVRYLRAFHNQAGATFVPSTETRDELRQLGFARVAVVGRGVDTVRFSPSRRSDEQRRAWGAQGDDLVLLCVARMAPEKDVPLAVDAFRAVRSVNPRARLVLVGDGPLRRRFSVAYPDVRFAGCLAGDDLARAYASADLFVFPSRTETFGNVIIEAMASGLPVVAFRQAAARDCIIDGETGLTVCCTSSGAFVEAAVRASRESELRRSLGRRASEQAAAFAWSAIGAALDRAIVKVAAERPEVSRRWWTALSEPAREAP